MKSSFFDPQFQHSDMAGKSVVGLERISESFRVLLWKHAKKIGLSPIQIQILIFVTYHDEGLCNVSHLAKEFNVTKPTMSDAIRVLIEKKLIERNYSLVDKRAYSITPTGNGKAIIHETEHFADPIRQVLKELKDSDQEQLFISLSKLIFALNKSGILSVQRICYGCKFYEKRMQNNFCHLLGKEFVDREIRVDCAEFEMTI